MCSFLILENVESNETRINQK